MKRLLTLLLFGTLSTAIFAQSNNYNQHEGNLDGAPYKVVIPQNWDSGNVFFHVHGWRPADAPHEADLDLDNLFYKLLLDHGWAIGRTAFQENGVDHDSHTEELFKLRGWIEENIGEINLLVLEGESTAGTLVLRIAEKHPDLADGVIAKGAFIDLSDSSADAYLEANPKIPAILMSNLTELDGPVSYAAAAEHAEVVPSLRPLLRPGHVNVNWVERLDAVHAMNRWLTSGEMSPVNDGTREVPADRSFTQKEGDYIMNTVTYTDRFFGNATLGFHPDELKEAGIEQGSSFIFEVHGQQRNVFYGQSYGDVAHGEWIAFPTADDQILLARNHESAIAAANLQRGNRVKIKPLSD